MITILKQTKIHYNEVILEEMHDIVKKSHVLPS
jgi:hypothetical protein